MSLQSRRCPAIAARLDVPSAPGHDPLPLAPNQPALFAVRKPIRNWRYVTGTFQIKIPVGSPATLLQYQPRCNTSAFRVERSGRAPDLKIDVQANLIRIGRIAKNSQRDGINEVG